MADLPIRVVIVDDDEDVRDLLVMLLELDQRFELVGVAADAPAGLALVQDLVPDALVMDLDMPEVSGLELLESVSKLALDVRVVVFSAFPDPFTLLDVLGRGADGYVDKATAWAELLPAVANLFHGHPVSV